MGGDAKLVPGGQDGGFDSGLPCVDGPRALCGSGITPCYAVAREVRNNTLPESRY